MSYRPRNARSIYNRTSIPPLLVSCFAAILFFVSGCQSRVVSACCEVSLAASADGGGTGCGPREIEFWIEVYGERRMMCSPCNPIALPVGAGRKPLVCIE